MGLIDEGSQALARGDGAAAETLARAALRQGENAAARLLLGRALVGIGRVQDGLGQIARAVELAPSSPETRAALGEALIAAGRLDQAAVAFARAWELGPDRPATLLRLVDVLSAAGRREAAIRHLGQALLAGPSAPLYVRLGRLLLEEGRTDDALAACNRARTLDPGSVEAVLLRADLYDRAGEPAEAVTLLEHAPQGIEIAGVLGDRLLAIDPDRALAVFTGALARHPADPGLGFGRARALYRSGRLAEAAEAMQSLADALPDHEKIHYELGLIQQETGPIERAEATFRTVIARHPTFQAPRLALASLLAQQDRVADAVAVQAATIERFPTAWEERASYGTNLLRLGQFRQGFAEHEFRLRTGKIEEPAGIGWYPLWLGERLDGRMLWLYPEQGFGDMIQFLRFAPRVAGVSGGRVVLGIFPALARLCGGLAGVDRMVTDEILLDPGAVRCPLMSLGDRLAITRATLPADLPYLTVPEPVRAQWAGRLDGLKGLKVGLIWSGNPKHKRDALRSIDPALLAPLGDIAGVDFVLLDRERMLEAGAGPLALFAPGAIKDFADTAAIVEQLDLVIAVDTAVAHLAGALGKPVWTLLDFEGDWRWSVEVDRTPWYPTMRLFRQSRPGDWPGVVDRVASALHQVVAGIHPDVLFQ